MNSLSTRGTWLFHKEEIQLYGLSVLSFLVAFHSRLCLLRRYNQDLIPGTCEDFIYEQGLCICNQLKDLQLTFNLELQ